MKHLLTDLREMLQTVRRIEMYGHVQTLEQWEDYKEENSLDELLEICVAMSEEISSYDDYFNDL